eukprot:151433_1
MPLTVQDYKNLTSSEQKKALKETKTKISKLSKQIDSEFDEFIQHQIPMKIISLNKLSKQIPSLFNPSESIQVDIIGNDGCNTQPPPRKRRKVNGKDTTGKHKNNQDANHAIWSKKTMRTPSEIGRLESNVEINESMNKISNLITNEILEIINITTSMKMSISLKIPSIQEGNNFGVEIQEDVVDDVSRAENGALDAIEQTTNYYRIRSKAISKILKWPNIDDYRHALTQFDKSHVATLKSMVVDLRNSYIILHDTITKNLEKLKNPREERSKYYLY